MTLHFIYFTSTVQSDMKTLHLNFAVRHHTVAQIFIPTFMVVSQLLLVKIHEYPAFEQP